MNNLELLEMQIDEFIEISGDDISSVVNHGDILAFSHVSLIEKNYNYDITLDKNGVIQLLSQEPVSLKSALNQDVSDSAAETLSKTVVVKESQAFNIQDVISFISECAA